MKAILMSIRPRHLADILNGYKTQELRKRVPKGFVGWVYLYCVLDKPYLVKIKGDYISSELPNYVINADFNRTLNGKVVARFWFDEFDSYYYNGYQGDYRLLSNYKDGVFINATMNYDELCLTESEINAYGNGKNLYAWHIKQLEIFDELMELGQFYKHHRYKNELVTPDICMGDKDCLLSFILKKAPQSWHFVYLFDLENPFEKENNNDENISEN